YAQCRVAALFLRGRRWRNGRIAIEEVRAASQDADSQEPDPVATEPSSGAWPGRSQFSFHVGACVVGRRNIRWFSTSYPVGNKLLLLASRRQDTRRLDYGRVYLGQSRVTPGEGRLSCDTRFGKLVQDTAPRWRHRRDTWTVAMPVKQVVEEGRVP